MDPPPLALDRSASENRGMDHAVPRLRENLAEVRGRIAEAARLSGRAPDQVRLVGVTKYVGSELAAALVEAGLADLGESRPQELWRKSEALAARGLPPLADPVDSGAAGPGVRWHLIGHLQRNKLARTLPAVALWHSADSLRVLAAADAWGRQTGRRVPVLLEVHLAAEASKGGFGPADLPRLGTELAALGGIEIRGLMTMATLAGGAAAARAEFARLRELRDRLSREWPAAISLGELSMGMSGDFPEAIAEGATLVRVGSALFGGLDDDSTRSP